MENLEKLLTRKQAAQFLCLRPQTLAVWAMTGRHLPVVTIGSRMVRYKLADLRAHVENQTTPAA